MSDLAQNIASPGLLYRRAHVRRLAIWVSLGLLIVAAVAALLMKDGVSRQLRDVEVSYAIRNAALELNNSLTQAEASQRGYLLTRDDQYLTVYQSSLEDVAKRSTELFELTDGDVAQRDRVQGINDDIGDKLAEMARAVHLVMTARPDEAQALTDSGLGARLMADVSDKLRAFLDDEESRRADRNAEISRMRNGLTVALLFALAAAAVLAYALLYRTQRQVNALANLREGLVSTNEALEREVAERTRESVEAREHAERERHRVETLLQDANHRIGNSLATVSSLLALQSMRTSSEQVRTALEAARMRVHAIASAHRRLRLGNDLENASAPEFLTSVIEDIANTQLDDGRISLVSDIQPIDVKSRDATTLGILVGELVTNAVKHAFPEDRTGTIWVSLAREADGMPTLTVADNGVGGSLDADTGGLGSVIVRQLASQFEGEPQYSTSDGGGLTVTIPLPALAAAATNEKADHAL